jgi:hypothetical protein
MAPAFSSTKQAAAFATLVLVLMLLPLFFGKSALPPREQIYSAVPWRLGPYPYLHDQIFKEKGDIDIAFMGASTMYVGIDTPYVEKALSKDLGHTATVITAAWVRPGFDALYITAQDLLEHRKVHTIVFTDVAKNGSNPHDSSPNWFRLGDNAEALAPLPGERIPRRELALFLPRLYFASILGMPRNLLSLVRPNNPEYLFSPDRLGFLAEVPGSVDNPADRLGSERTEFGYRGSPFVEYTPVSKATPSDACIYSATTANEFQFTNEPLSPLQLHFAEKFALLARKYGTHLIVLELPNTTDTSSPRIQFRGYWPDILHTDVAMIGIPPAKVFSGMTPTDITKLFYDPNHWNKNGQEYFAKLITPALLKEYETQSKN